MKHDTFDYRMNDILTARDYTHYSVMGYQHNKPKQATDNPTTVRRLHLFWDYRYQSGSYKAIKAGISRPTVMMRYKHDRFRLYGNPTNNKLFDHCKVILAGWKAREKADRRLLIPEYKQWLKEKRLKAKDNPFWYWNTHIRLQLV